MLPIWRHRENGVSGNFIFLTNGLYKTGVPGGRKSRSALTTTSGRVFFLALGTLQALDPCRCSGLQKVAKVFLIVYCTTLAKFGTWWTLGREPRDRGTLIHLRSKCFLNTVQVINDIISNLITRTTDSIWVMMNSAMSLSSMSTPLTHTFFHATNIKIKKKFYVNL